MGFFQSTFGSQNPTPVSPSTSSGGGGFFAQTFGAQTPTVPAPSQSGGFLSTLANAGKSAFNFLTGAEQGFGNDIAAATTNVLPKSFTGVQQLDQAAQQHASNLVQTANLIKTFAAQGKDTTKLQTILQSEAHNAPPTLADVFPALQKTNWQVVGDAAGTLADILTAGTYGAEAKAGAASGKLLTKTANEAALAPARDFAQNVISGVTGAASKAAPTLGSRLADIGARTAIHSATGAGIGYGYDVAGNLQQGKEGAAALTPGAGTAVGAIAPALIGGVRAGVAVSKEQAPRFINSLIKPKTADFSYGKDPGRTVSEMGITGNSLPDFAANISAAKKDVGQQLGAVYSNPANANIRINASDDITKIDAAIQEAAKGGKNNQTIVTQLQNVKDAILYEHGIDKNGNIAKVGETPRDLSNLSLQESQDLIQHVADQTQFTGRPSDDKTVNSVLKNIYGGIREKINAEASVNNPEVETLNQRYADLTSAEIATQNRDKIIQRSNLISLNAGGAGAAGAIVTAIATGGAAIPTILFGAGAAALEKAFETAAVKSRVAAWLGKQTPNTIQKFLAAHPAIAPVMRRVFPALISKATH